VQLIEVDVLTLVIEDVEQAGAAVLQQLDDAGKPAWPEVLPLVDDDRVEAHRRPVQGPFHSFQKALLPWRSSLGGTVKGSPAASMIPLAQLW